jgi:hypothetical protein
MEALIDIKFDDLLKIVKSLPESKLSQLKAEIEKDEKKSEDREDFRALLLNGPTFSKSNWMTLPRPEKL